MIHPDDGGRLLSSKNAMKHSVALFLLALAASAFAQSTTPPEADGHWSKQQLTDNFWAEGATAADVNKDGKMDVHLRAVLV